MSIQYRAVAFRRLMSGDQYVTLYYGEDRETVIKELHKHYTANGFSINTPKGRFSVYDLLLIEEMLTGEELSRTSYYQLFDVYGKRIKESET